MSNNAPLGADEHPNCPWFNEEPKSVTVDVFISQTLSVSTKVEVREGYDEDDLKKAVLGQITLPSNFCKLFSKRDWVEDEFTVIEE